MRPPRAARCRPLVTIVGVLGLLAAACGSPSTTTGPTAAATAAASNGEPSTGVDYNDPPGTEGAGIADVLLGDAPFRGTTPYTWPARPPDAPRTSRGACDGAVFPVGFGLDAAGQLLGPAACAPATP